MKILVLILVAFFNLNFCSSNKTNEIAEQYIEKITFQNWVGGIKGAGGGTNLNITLLKPLPESTTLIKIQFQNREGMISKLDDGTYQSSIKTFDNELETAPTSIITTNLKPNQAKIFFNINGKVNTTIINDVIELPMLAYPSAKPNNN